MKVTRRGANGPQTPDDVFTPFTSPNPGVYELRQETEGSSDETLEERLRQLFTTRGGQVFIYGETGVGKTSLVNEIARSLGHKKLYVLCNSGHRMTSILDEAIHQLESERLTKRTRGSKVGGEAGADVGHSFLASLKTKVSGELDSTKEYEQLIQSSAEVLHTAMIRNDRKLLVLDDFQAVEDADTRREVFGFANRLAGLSTDRFDAKVVLISIAERASVVQMAGDATYRRFQPLEVPRMEDEAVIAFLKKGCAILGVSASQDALEHLAYLSDGVPASAHRLALAVSKRALRESEAISIDLAKEVAGEMGRSLMAGYEDRMARAIETRGDLRLRRTVLNLLIRDRRIMWTTSEVRDLVERAEYVDDLSKVNSALSDLTTEKRGEILSRTVVGGISSFRFKDTLLRAYLRMQLDSV